MIFCDLDGTLVDSKKDITFAVNETRRTFKLSPLTVDQVVSYIGNGIRKLVERSFNGTGVDLDEALPLMKDIYSRHLLDSTRLYPGVIDGLHLLVDANFAIVLLSNKTQKEAVKILKGLAVADYFSLVLGDGVGIPLKPDPSAIFHARKVLKPANGDSWIIGDSWTDLECGDRAGIQCAFASYGFGYPHDKRYDFMAESFLQFAEMAVKTRAQ